MSTVTTTVVGSCLESEAVTGATFTHPVSEAATTGYLNTGLVNDFIVTVKVPESTAVSGYRLNLYDQDNRATTPTQYLQLQLTPGSNSVLISGSGTATANYPIFDNAEIGFIKEDTEIWLIVGGSKAYRLVDGLSASSILYLGVATLGVSPIRDLRLALNVDQTGLDYTTRSWITSVEPEAAFTVDESVYCVPVDEYMPDTDKPELSCLAVGSCIRYQSPTVVDTGTFFCNNATLSNHSLRLITDEHTNTLRWLLTLDNVYLSRQDTIINENIVEGYTDDCGSRLQVLDNESQRTNLTDFFLNVGVNYHVTVFVTSTKTLYFYRYVDTGFIVIGEIPYALVENPSLTIVDEDPATTACLDSKPASDPCRTVIYNNQASPVVVYHPTPKENFIYSYQAQGSVGIWVSESQDSSAHILRIDTDTSTQTMVISPLVGDAITITTPLYGRKITLMLRNKVFTVFLNDEVQYRLFLGSDTVATLYYLHGEIQVGSNDILINPRLDDVAIESFISSGEFIASRVNCDGVNIASATGVVEQHDYTDSPSNLLTISQVTVPVLENSQNVIVGTTLANERRLVELKLSNNSAVDIQYTLWITTLNTAIDKDLVAVLDTIEATTISDLDPYLLESNESLIIQTNRPGVIVTADIHSEPLTRAL